MKFAQKNDKTYYFSGGVIFLPFSLPYLHNIIKYKEYKKEKVEKNILPEKNHLLRVERKASLKNKRLSLIRNILLPNPTCYQISSQKRNANQNLNFSQTTRSYILNSFGRKMILKIDIIMTWDLVTIF